MSKDMRANTQRAVGLARTACTPAPARFCLMLLLSVSMSYAALGAPVSAKTAVAAVRGWLQMHGSPLGAHLSKTVSEVEPFPPKTGAPDYYVVSLSPQGFVVVPADDGVEPIVAFSARGHYDPSPVNPLAVLIRGDVPERVAETQAQARPAALNPGHRAKWQRLLEMGGASQGGSAVKYGLASVSDIRVAPLVQTLWSQSSAFDAGSVACYNYFTPPYTAGNVHNYVCGCVATAMAQLMRYWQYPTASVGTPSFTITVDGEARTAQLLGGDGLGGPYDWADMPTLAAGSGIPTVTQCRAIGALTHDAGAAVRMEYTSTASTAYPNDAKAALVSVFQYANAVIGEQGGGIDLGAGLIAMVNPNLDAHHPVLLGIRGDINGQIEGHEIVCDGYGYNLSTLYHHINMGWSGADDVWYALPHIDAQDGYAFTVVDSCIYNVFRSGGGEIVSGRVLDSNGAPVSNATVTATRAGGATYTATTDSKGIYALSELPSASQYSLTATAAGLSPGTATCSTGASSDGTSVSGNRWGVNVTVGAAPAGVDHFAWGAIGSPQTANQPFNVTVTAVDAANATVTGFSGTAALSATASGATSLFAEDFEDGSLSGWTTEGGAYTRFIDSIGANGTSKSLSLIGGSATPYDGLSRSFANLAPDRIDFYVRASTSTNVCGYFVFGRAKYRTNSVALFFMNNNGMMGLATPDGTGFYGTPYAAGQWYKISFLLNWSAKTLDYYVNGALVAAAIPFCNPTLTGISTLNLYNYDHTQAWWDQIEFVQGAGNIPVPVSPTTSSAFVNGVWTGNILVQQAAPNVVLTASDGAGHLGSSAPFSVVSSASENPAMISPPPGSTLTSSTVTFQWSAGSGVSEYFLYVGRSPGTNDLYGQSEGLKLSAIVAGLPVDGSKLYVRLWWKTAPGWQSVDYTYTSGGTKVPSPTISALNVAPSTVAVGGAITISYTVADAGGPGLAQAELWRYSESAGQWSVRQTNSCSGTASVSGSFADTPQVAGSYAYGMHVVDVNGDTKAESDFGLGPIWVTVTPPGQQVYPAIEALQVTPAAAPIGTPLRISYTIADPGGPGLASVELWRASDDGSTNDPTWAAIGVQTVTGTAPVSGSFVDAPCDSAAFWYGLHAVDGQGFTMDERTAGVGPLKVVVSRSTVNVPASLATAPGSGVASEPGFRLRVVQLPMGSNNSELNPSAYAIEQVLAGLWGTNEDLASANVADLSAFTDSGYLDLTGVINFSGANGGTDLGDFTSANGFPDQAVPGIPGRTGSQDQFAAEILTYLEFPTAGTYTMGVASDDCFRMYAAEQGPAFLGGTLYVTAPAAIAGVRIPGDPTWADAGFGSPPLPAAPISGKVVYASPNAACSPLSNPDELAGNVALVDRGTCEFGFKCLEAQQAGAIAVLIANNVPDLPVSMGPGSDGAQVTIPIVMLHQNDAALLKAHLSDPGGVWVTFGDDPELIFGEYNNQGGRATADTLFSVAIPKAGVYPFRLAWNQGGGPYSCEWFTVDAAGNRTLINDTLHGGLKAYRARLPVLPCPADADADFRIVINEVTAYGAAWKRGDIWNTPPNPIPIDYVTRVGYLWKNGECYTYDSSQSPPLCWVSQPCAGGGGLAPQPKAIIGAPGTPGASAMGVDASSIVRAVDGSGVSLAASPGAGVAAYAVEETLPAGLTPYPITGGASWDAANRKLKWGPYFDNKARKFCYELGGVAGVYRLSGVASFDGQDFTTTGATSVDLGPSLALLNAGFTPAGDFTFTFPTEAGEQYYIECSGSLSRPQWQVVEGPLPGTGRPIRWTDDRINPGGVPPGSVPHFYRVMSSPGIP